MLAKTSANMNIIDVNISEFKLRNPSKSGKSNLSIMSHEISAPSNLVYSNGKQQSYPTKLVLVYFLGIYTMFFIK